MINLLIILIDSVVLRQSFLLSMLFLHIFSKKDCTKKMKICIITIPSYIIGLFNGRKLFMNRKLKINLLLMTIFTQFGSGILWFILSFKVLQQNKSATDFSKILVFSAVFSIVGSLLAGKIVDKYNKKWIMICCQTISVISLFIFGIYVFNSNNVGVIPVIALSSLLQLFDTSFVAALNTSAINLVDEQSQLNQFNSLVSSVNSIGSLISPVIGGILFNWFSIEIFVFAEVILELVAIMFIFKLPFKKVDIQKFEAQSTNSSEDYNIFGALKYVFKNQNFALIFICFVVTTCLLGATTVGVPFMIMKKFADDSFLTGIIKTGAPIGLFLGAIVYQKIAYTGNFKKPVSQSLLLMATAFISLGFLAKFVENYYLFAGLLALSLLLLGASLSYCRIPMVSFYQAEVPQNIQGRIFSYIDVCVECSMPISLAIYGFLFDRVEINLIYFITGILVLIFLFIFFMRINVNQMEIKNDGC